MAIVKFSLTVSPSPLGDVTQDVFYEDMTAPKGKTLSFLTKKSSLKIDKNVYVFVNGNRASALTIIKNGDHVLVRAKANEASTIALIVSSLISYAVNYAVSYVIGYLIKELSGGGNDGNTPRVAKKDTEGYGLSGGGNQYRLMQPMPRVYGKHRIYPDFSQPWYVDYVKDAEPPEIYPSPDKLYRQDTFQNFLFQNPPNANEFFTTTGSWSVLVGYGEPLAPLDVGQPDPTVFGYTRFGQFIIQGFPGVTGDEIYYGDNQPFTFVDQLGETVTLPHKWIVKVKQSATPQSPYSSNQFSYVSASEILHLNKQYGSSPPFFIEFFPYTNPQNQEFIVYSYGYSVDRWTQRLTSVFNYGFGDLKHTDYRIGQTKLTDFKNYKLDQATFTNTASVLGTRSDAPNFNNGNITSYPSGVESVDGAKLINYAGIVDSGYVIRQSTVKRCRRIEFDLSGRLAAIESGQSQNLSADFLFEYRIIGAAGWTVAFGGPQTITNGLVFKDLRYTRGVDVPIGIYEARCRKVTEDVKESDKVCDIQLERIKFFEVNDYEYQAQNRVAIQIIASSQLNGALDRFSSLVSASTWRWVGGVVWDGNYPGTGPNWVWGETSNPSSWYLDHLLGAYFNDVAFSGNTQGFHVGPNVNNGRLIYGYGLAFSKIDFDYIVKWSNYCETNNLEINAVLDSAKSNLDLLIDIGRTGRGSPAFQNGKRSVVFFDKNEPVSGAYGMGNILKGSFSVTYKSSQNTDAVILNFLDRDDFFSTKQVRATVPGVTRPFEFSTVNLWGCTGKAQAQREVNLIAADQRYHARTIKFNADIEGTTLRRGDVIRGAHDLTGWAYSGRLVNGYLDALGAYTVEFDCLPNGTYDVLFTDAVGGQFLWIGATVFDGKALGGDANLSGLILPDTQPDDVLFHAGKNGGKKLRVLSVVPISDKQVTITCTDEDSRYYDEELAPGAGPIYPDLENNQYKATAAQLSIDKNPNGVYLNFELMGAPTASIFGTFNNAGLITSGTTTSNDVTFKLPSYPSGTVATFIVTPSGFNQVASQTISYTYP